MATMFDVIRKAMLAGFGVQEKVNEFVQEMIEKGELSSSQGAKLVKEWSNKAEKSGEELNKTVADLVKTAVGKVNVATTDDLEKLSRKVQALSARVKKLEESQGASTQ